MVQGSSVMKPWLRLSSRRIMMEPTRRYLSGIFSRVGWSRSRGEVLSREWAWEGCGWVRSKAGLVRPSSRRMASSSASDLPEHTVLQFPKLSPTMNHGTMGAWKKAVGDKVTAGDVLAEIETDKATVEFEAQEDGFLAKILVPQGQNEVPVGHPAAVIVVEKSHVGAFAGYEPGLKPHQQKDKPEEPHREESKQDLSKYPSHTLVLMPKLSPSPGLTSSLLGRWLKKEGDEVGEGDAIAEVETDKKTVPLETLEAGFVAKLLAEEKTDIRIGDPIAVIVGNSDDVMAFKNFTASSDRPSSPSTKPSQAQGGPKAPIVPDASSPREVDLNARKKDGRLFASPLARRKAAEAGISLSGVSGSGPNGRIVAADVEKAANAGPVKRQSSQPSELEFDDIELGKIQKITAKRLLESKQTIPHYYLTMECTVDKMLKLREELNRKAKNGEYKLSVNDFVIKAAACALLEVPEVNSQWMGDVIRRFHSADISVAVATENGLITPIVKTADRKGLKAISADVRELAAKAKANKLHPNEFIGGTFTISNLGMFGISDFAAVINPPQAAILAIGATAKRVVPSDDSTKVANLMTVTLSCDHRVVDGAVGARWLQAFKERIEDPINMLM